MVGLGIWRQVELDANFMFLGKVFDLLDYEAK